MNYNKKYLKYKKKYLELKQIGGLYNCSINDEYYVNLFSDIKNNLLYNYSIFGFIYNYEIKKIFNRNYNTCNLWIWNKYQYHELSDMWITYTRPTRRNQKFPYPVNHIDIFYNNNELQCTIKKNNEHIKDNNNNVIYYSFDNTSRQSIDNDRINIINQIADQIHELYVTHFLTNNEIDAYNNFNNIIINYLNFIKDFENIIEIERLIDIDIENTNFINIIYYYNIFIDTNNKLYNYNLVNNELYNINNYNELYDNYYNQYDDIINMLQILYSVYQNFIFYYNELPINYIGNYYNEINKINKIYNNNININDILNNNSNILIDIYTKLHYFINEYFNR
jgi:hypothetical protein